MATIVVSYENEDYSKQIEYIFKLFFSVYGVDWRMIPYAKLFTFKPDAKDVVITYGKNRPRGRLHHQIHIYESHLFGQDYLKASSMPNTPLKRFDGIPIIYQGNNQVEGHVKHTEGLIETDIDIIASSFFMLTRYEEVVAPVQDKFERYPATASLAYREGFLERPIVNEYIELLWDWIDSFGLGFQRKNLWEGKDFAVCLTHDVDRIRKFRIIPPLLTLRCALFKKKNFKNALTIFEDYVKTNLRMKSDPYQVAFERVIDLEKRQGVRSSFYFMAHGEDYSIRNPFIVDLITRLKNENFEIGLHGSFDSYNNPTILKQEKERIQEVVENSVIGSRQHYLRWKTPDTWRALEKAGFIYDTTLGFADQVGFRSGICYPYKPFDIIENKEIDIWEVPLIVMDGSLFGYQNLSLEEGLKKIKKLIDVVAQYRGIFVTLWHNSSFYELENPGVFQIYRQMLEYITNKNALCSSVQDVLKIWCKAVKLCNSTNSVLQERK